MQDTSNLHEVFRANVKRRLDELDLTQRDFAEVMKVTEQYISQLLAGRNIPGLGLVERVARKLETTAQYLLTPVAPETISGNPPISAESGVDSPKPSR